MQMDTNSDTNHSSNKLDEIDEAHMESLGANEDFWDYLDQLEYEAGGCREWDNMACGGAA